MAGLDVFTLAGLLGTGLLIAAYFANQIGRFPSDDWRFPFANLLGSCLILISLFVSWNLPSVIIEGFWIAISLFGVARQLRRRS